MYLPVLVLELVICILTNGDRFEYTCQVQVSSFLGLSWTVLGSWLHHLISSYLLCSCAADDSPPSSLIPYMIYTLSYWYWTEFLFGTYIQLVPYVLIPKSICGLI
jgi:hypothetical protein